MKYMGSKSRIAKYIVPIIQNYIDKNNIKIYLEPFVGGGNIIDKIKCDTKVGSDNNKYLIALLKRVQQGLPLYDEVPRELYNKVRTAFNNHTIEFEDWQLGNIGFLSSYNGRFFDGGYAQTGYEKTKIGLRLRNYYQEAKNNLLTQAENLKDIQFFCNDYRDYITVDLKNCLIYCDPPYNHTKKFKNSTNFNYDEFWETMRNWSLHNIVLISEQTAPNDFKCIWQQQVSRSIDANNKSTAVEKLFIYDINYKDR